ncbi:MAG TPA: precorrin-6y C5,15-methyltransferase (decarboxylating) subunit CbiE [Polyangia bacterium]|jgi:precorrin-6Y C5,15-methyltransferase (decarboxylating)|nr:precorrin-6y C5,15-methyltransferase (decarboxylating) subunit CbiE [Polyangia bacterium]
MTSRRRAVTLVGIGDDGCKGLTSRALDAVASAAWLVGGERQLAFFPQFGGQRIVLKDGIGAAIDRVAAIAVESNVCVLASGDPMFFGVGALVVKRLGAEHVEVIPQPSSVQWAFARTGQKWDDAVLLSLHGRARRGFLTRLRRHAKVAVLTDEENSPPRLAAHLVAHGQTGWTAWVCENLAGPGERVRRFTVEELAAVEDVGSLNVLLLMRSDVSWRAPPAIPFLHEDTFARRMPRKGLITKREVRLLSLAGLGIRPDSVVWDIGAGSGSVSIEAALLAPEGRVYAIEVDPEGVAICGENLRAHAVDNVEVIAGRAPEALAGLDAPDAVFVGGSKGSLAEIIEVALARLNPGGRLVANAITLENAAEAYQAIRARGLLPEVTLLQISRGEPLGPTVTMGPGAGAPRYLRYEALNPIQIFAVTKPPADQEVTP